MDANSTTGDFPDHNNNSALFNSKKKRGEIRAGGTKYIEIMVPLKCLINFWRTLEMPSTNFEINVILTWSEKCMLSNSGNRATICNN